MDNKKIKVKLIGQDGNIFNLMAITRRALIKDGQEENAEKMIKEIENSGSYDEAIYIITKYVDII